MDTTYDNLTPVEINHVDYIVKDRFCRGFTKNTTTMSLCKRCRFIMENAARLVIIEHGTEGYHMYLRNNVSDLRFLFSSMCNGKIVSVFEAGFVTGTSNVANAMSDTDIEICGASIPCLKNVPYAKRKQAL